MNDIKKYNGDAAVLVPPTGTRTFFSGLNPTAAAYVLAEMIRRRPAAFLVYMPTPVEAEDFARDLEFFWPEGASSGAVMLCPAYEIKPFAGESPSQDLVFSRMTVFSALLSGRTPLVIIVSAPGAMQLSLPKKALSEHTEYVESGEEVDRDALLGNLTRMGYYSTAMVQSQGDFSVRGGILDFYPPGAARPVRAEFFGDLIESLRSFRTLDQRSVDDLLEQEILPASEIIFEPGKEMTVAAEFEKLCRSRGWLDLLWAPLVEKMASGQYFPGLESFLPLFYDRLASVHDYAGPGVINLVFDPDRIVEAGKSFMDKLERHMDKIASEERPHLPLESLFLRPEEIVKPLADSTVIEVQELVIGDKPQDAVQFSLETALRYPRHDGRSARRGGASRPIGGPHKELVGAQFKRCFNLPYPGGRLAAWPSFLRIITSRQVCFLTESRLLLMENQDLPLWWVFCRPDSIWFRQAGSS